MIAYTIRAAQEASKLTDWVVSTEDREIATIALSYGASVIKRPPDLSADDVTSGAVVRHALDWMEDAGRYDLVVLLHPSSPVRDPRHIDRAIWMLWNSNAPALASVECRKRTYVHNASIYAMKRDWFVQTNKHYCDESIPFLMDKRHSIDIDEEIDFQTAELLLKNG